jgi:predicted PurR-regulated permease PerM
METTQNSPLQPTDESTGQPAAEIRNPANDDAAQPEKRTPTRTMPILRRTRVSRVTVIGLLAILTVAMYPIVKIFMVPVIVAATFTTLFHPLFLRFMKIFRNKRGISAFVCCLIILLCFIAPTYLVVNIVLHQGFDLYQTAGPTIKDFLAKGSQSETLLRLKDLPIVHWLQISQINLSIPLNEALQKLVTVGTSAINKTSAGLLDLLMNIFVMFFTMFYFFKDGDALVRRLRYIVPIREEYADLFVKRFLLISRATVLGTVILAITQGTLGAIVLMSFGVQSWLMWGVVMGILSLMPFVGAWTILVPAGIIKLVMGDTYQGIAIIGLSLLVISNIDNFVRPRLVGGTAKLHDLMIFFSSLGGIAVFGPLGFIVGPVLAALFVAVLDIYEMEFKQHLGLFDSERTPSKDA